MERVALCIPCFNAAPYLPGLAESIRAQTRPFDEVILCDDASTDGSAEVAAGLGAFGLILRRRRRGGPALARNDCLRRVDAAWVHFQDADDTMAPAFLERLLAASRDADVVLADGASFAEDGRPCGGFRHGGLARAADPVGWCIAHDVGGTFGLYRTSALEAAGGFAEDLAGLGWEDRDLHVRLAHAGARFAAVEEELVLHRITSGGFSRADPSACHRGGLAAAERYLRTLGPGHRAAVLSGVAVIARDCDNRALWAEAGQAWALLRREGAEVLHSRRPAARALARLLGPDVVSALRAGAPGQALRRAGRRLAGKR